MSSFLKRSLPSAHYLLIGYLLVRAAAASETRTMTRSGKRPGVRQGGAFASAPAAGAAIHHDPLTPVVFKGTGAYRIAGPESRQVYWFSAHDPEQMVDARDADALLKTGLFRTTD